MKTESSASANDTLLSAADEAAYRAAMDAIYGRLNYERVSHDSYDIEDFRLARMARFLELLGQPQLRLPVVHVAGTKGKGSTSAMLAAMLQAAGLRVGLFTSPHLLRFEERMTVNGVEPGHQEIVGLVDRVRDAVEQLVVEMPPGPTFFEMTTALAWLHFLHQRCDLAVLEVGLGGRLDSTNLCQPLCSVIASISRDHTRLLGDTLPQIAAEKAGIIKPGVPVVTGVEDPEVRKVIEEFARRAAAPIFRLSREIHIRQTRSTSDPGRLPCFTAQIETPWRSHPDLEAPLPGAHQCRNMALAVTVFDLLSDSWRPLDPSAVERGLADVRWPLRIEQISDHPRVILDTAHNDASMTALCETLSTLQHPRRILVYATSRDKDAAAMLRILNDSFDEAILTRYVHNPRALPLDQLVGIAQDVMSITLLTANDPAAAWKLAHEDAGEDGMICVTGSLFLAAEMQVLAEGAAE